MARVNLDGKVWKDPRTKRLAFAKRWSMRETVGTLAAIWDVAYDNKSPLMLRIDVDVIAECDGFADELVRVGFADEAGDSLRLCGIDERIGYLLAQAERGRNGGLAKATAKAKQTRSKRYGRTKQPPSLPLTPDLALSPPPSLPLDHVDTVSGRPDVPAKVLEFATFAVDEINRLTRTSNEPTTKTTIANATALVKAGVTHERLLAVIRDKGKEWLPNSPHLMKPSVLMRPSNFTRYGEEMDARRPRPRVESTLPFDDEPDLTYGIGVVRP